MKIVYTALLELTTASPTSEPTLEPTARQPTTIDAPPVPTLEPTLPTESPTHAPTERTPVQTLPANVMLYSTTILNLEKDQGISFYLSEDSLSSQIAIVLTGPSDVYYAVGFGNNMMDGTYTIIVDGFGDVSERILGSHSPGNMLQSSLTVMINQVKDGIRTVAVLRDINLYHKDYYNFQSFVDDCQYGIPLIYSHGFSPSFGFHEQWGNNVKVYGECSINDNDIPHEPMPSNANYTMPTIYIAILSILYFFFLY